MPGLLTMTVTLLQAPKPDKQSAIGNRQRDAHSGQGGAFCVPWTVTARRLF